MNFIKYVLLLGIIVSSNVFAKTDEAAAKAFNPNVDCINERLFVTRAMTVEEKNAFNSALGKPLGVNNLNEFEFSLKLYKDEGAGRLSYLGSSATVDAGNYKMIYAFQQYLTEGYDKYGVSIRLEINFSTKGKKLDIGSIPGLSASASKSTISGNISMSVHGLVTPKAAYILPIPTSLNEASASQFLNYMGILKTMISEADAIQPVKLSPCV